MLTVNLGAGQINAVDAPSGATEATLNVDLREQVGASGIFSAQITQTAVAAGTVTLPASLDVVDNESGNQPTSTLDIDFRGAAGSGGIISVQVPTASLSAIAAPAAAPTLGSNASGTLGAHTAFVKVTYTGAFGETAASAEATLAVAADHELTVASPSAETGASGWNVYATDVASGTETLQNLSPIAIGTGWTEPGTGITNTGAAPPTNSAVAAGNCNVVVAVGSGALTAGACTLTLEQ